MAATLGDFLSFDIKYHVLGQECHNVFYYRVTSITGLAGDYLTVLNTWMLDNLVAAMVGVQGNHVDYDDVTGKNLTNALDFAVNTSASVGTLSSSATSRLPSWMTMSFKLLRESLATRNGWKRISGMIESQADENSWNVSGAPITAIQDAFADDVTIGIATIAEPVILKRPLPAIVPNTHIYSSIGGCTFRTLIGSQGTRKPGVGV